MPGFLLTWNPAIGDQGDNWSDDDLVKKLISPFRRKGEIFLNWRTAAPRKMQIGDQVFLLKQGPRPKGIFGIGTVVKMAEREPDEPDRFRVRVQITKLVNPVKGEFLAGEMALTDMIGKLLVGARFSGRSIPEDRLKRLNKYLAKG
jgi:hypothetical protein